METFVFGGEEVISFLHKRFTYLQILYCLLVRYTRTRNQTLHGNKDWDGFKSTPEYRTLDRIDGGPMEFKWIIFQGFNTLQLSPEVLELLLRFNGTPGNFPGRIISILMFTTSHVDQNSDYRDRCDPLSLKEVKILKGRSTC